MAGMTEIFALAGAGLAINDRDQRQEIKNRNNKSKIESKNTTDIYTTNNSRKTRDREESLARKRFRDSRRFKDTKIIPKNYKDYEDWLNRNKNKPIRSSDFNKEVGFGTDRRRHSTGSMDIRNRSDFNAMSDDSEFSDVESFSGSVSSNGSDDGYHGINPNKPDSVLDRMSSITNNKKFESCVAKPSKSSRNKYAERDTWTNQFEHMTFDNPGEAVSSNSVAQTSGRNANLKRVELERQMEIDGGFSAFDADDDGAYGVIRPDSSDFIHNNMQPFISKAPNARHEAAMNDVKQQRLELFTGSADQVDYRPKVERAPLFSPLVGVKNIYGDPVRTDEYKSRYFAGNEKRNELPFASVKVTPGLNIGYNAVGKQGYHDMYRVVDRGVDELRTLNNPKISYGSYVAPAGKGEKGPVVGKVSHYKPQTFKERDEKDMVRQAAYYSAPTVYGTYDPKNLATVNRGVKETMQIGHAQHHVEGNTPGKFRGNWGEAKRENYKYDTPRNIHHVEHFAGQGHNNESFVPDQTKRNFHDKYDHPRNIHGYEEQKGQGHNNDSFLPDQTKRGVHGEYDRSGAAIVGGRYGITTVDWTDVMDPTKRDIHQSPDRAGFVTGEKQQIIAVDYSDIPDPTKRNIADKYDRMGKAITGNRQQYITVNWDDVPDVTKREIFNKYDRAGLAINGNRNEYMAVNYDDIPDATKRNVHDKFDRAGLAISGEKQQILAVNYDDIPDVTKRDIHNKFDRAGKAVTGNRQEYMAVNFDDIPDVTKRDIHNKFDRAGKAVTGARQEYMAVDYDDIPDVTKRDVHNKFDRAGKAVTGARQQYIAVDYDDIPDVTKRDIHNKFDRAGKAITGARQEYIAVDYDDIPDVTKREIHNKPDRAGHVTGARQNYLAVDYDDIPDVTNREMHPGNRTFNVTGNKTGYHTVDWDDVPDVTNREIHPGGRTFNVTGNREQYKSVNWDDVPDVTKREIHPGGRAGAAYSDNRRQGSRHQYMVMKTNAGKEALEEGRAPTKVGMDKGYTLDHTKFHLKEMVQGKWRPNPGSDTMYTNDSLRSVNTRVPTGRVIYNDRILSFTAENLEGNQEINNLIHKSVNFDDY